MNEETAPSSVIPHSSLSIQHSSEVDRAIRRWRWTRRAVWGLIVLLGGSVFFFRTGWAGYRGDDWAAFDRASVTIRDAVDGQTVLVTPADRSDPIRIRLVGVASPLGQEHWTAASRQALADRAGVAVTLRLESTRSRDPAGDLLAYAYLPDASLLNLELIKEGQAYADRRTAFAQRPQFEQAENEARQKKRGLWKAVKEPDMPAWRQDWLKALREKRAAEQPRTK